ncbi:MAG: hypothetical protein IAG10_00075, partial [Planctomycetaceae bacterium]|nr:hypothetical protein [Planctomycetaceae bacterium]
MEDRLWFMLLMITLCFCLIGSEASAEGPDWASPFRQQETPWLTLEWQRAGDLDLLRGVLVKQEENAPKPPPINPALEPSFPLPP